MPLIEPEKKAPAFVLKDQHGNTHRLADYAGRSVIVYFYPKDDTPGCTVEACGFRDDADALARAGAVVMGVSTQDVASHQAFAEKYKLAFTLVADPDKRVTKTYGALNLVGYAKRVTYLIGPDGRVARVWDKVSPRGHSREVLEAVQALWRPA
jgi:peroxiredoxin Q/BCP